MEILLLYIYGLCMSVFFGSSVFMGFIVAPYIFKTTATRNEAGNLVGLLLEKLAILTYFTQIILIISGAVLAYFYGYPSGIIILPILIIIINFISDRIIGLKMRRLKQNIGNIDSTPKDDKNRLLFNSLHKWSVKLFILNQLLTMPLFYLIFK